MGAIYSSFSASSSAVFQHQCISASNYENKESTALIWFDPTIGLNEDTKTTMNQLREINNYVKFYTELEQCVTFIQSIGNEKIFLVTSGSRASEILPRIATLRQIDCVFIFCMDKAKYEHLIDEYPKTVGIYVDIDSLYGSIKKQIALVDKQLETFSFFDQHQRSIKDLSKESAEFLWFQLFNNVISRFPRNQQAKKQMLDMCRLYYRDNLKEQKLIEQFEHAYRPEEAIQWYSKQSFVYKLVNKALRTEDIDQLHKFRFFIGDLSESLAREHKKIVLSNEKALAVYRGVKLPSEEFKKLKENEGKLISTNGFLSTSRDRSTALKFAMAPTNSTDGVPILFEINCNVEQLGDSVIFADIADFSEYPEEKEVLFDLSAAFRLESIRLDGKVWLITMSASSDGQAITQNYINETCRDTEWRSIAIIFGKLLSDMGQYDKSQAYFQQLLIDPNGEDFAWIEYNIGRALRCKRQRENAREYYDRAYNRMMSVDPPRIKDSAYVLNSIGSLLLEEEKYDEAIEFYQRVLTIHKTRYPTEHSEIAYSHNCIGNVLKKQGKYDKALKSYCQALDIRKKCCPTDFPAIAVNLNCIGNVLKEQGKYDKALESYQQALTVHKNYYSTGHPNIAYSLSSIGNVLKEQGKYDEALDFNRQALKIRKECYPTDHPAIAKSLNCIEHLERKKTRKRIHRALQRSEDM